MTWFYDHLAAWAFNAANAVSVPFLRLERWAHRRWKASVTWPQECPLCHGNGEDEPGVECHRCGGRGLVPA